jgi:NAD(P)H-hydrate repair Nnr-like enzyme with NAD(P)H-hydrate dehydratase domain
MEPRVVLDQRFDVGGAVSTRLGATVLLKGVPTVVFGPKGTRLVSATGTPLLATGGSGDVLSGIVGTLLAQLGDATTAAAIGAWIHGRAAERVSDERRRRARSVARRSVVGTARRLVARRAADAISRSRRAAEDFGPVSEPADAALGPGANSTSFAL